MLKKVKLNNSTIIIVGVFIITLGIAIGMYEYFEERKNKAFSDMNIVLYEKEQPMNIIEEQTYQSDNSLENELSTQNTKPIVNNYLGILEIPKINLKRGFFGVESKYNNVDYNITIINGSTFPDEENSNLILAAHSGDCPVCYFENLYKLQVDDIAYLNYKNINYSYKIVNIYEVEKNGTVAIRRDSTKKVLTLITCTKNSNTTQTVYILEEIN